MMNYLKYILPIVCLASCKQDEIIVAPEYPEAVELKTITAVVAENTATRAAALDAFNYVGRSSFDNGDVMVLTTIKRTSNPINGFTYSGIEYKQEIEQGQTSGGWNRDMQKGHALDENGQLDTSKVPERIYWSDAHNEHTYIGFSVPQGAFDWRGKEDTYESSTTKGIMVYYGSLGDPTVLTDPNDSSKPAFIDYTNNADDEGEKDEPSKDNSAISKKTGNEKIKKDDLLLTYDTKKVAETGGSVAKLYYHHALAMVRVVVNIQGFSASTDAADSKSVVQNMVLNKMLTMYKWRQQSYAVEALDETYDKSNINAIYNNDTDYPVKFDQKKNVHLWIPRPDGTGTGTGRQFTFYGLAVPCSMGVDNPSTEVDKDKNLHFEFQVIYPNPMNPTQNITKDYKAMMPNHIKFEAGKCTTINITLNHSNEQMTVGAEYMDWQLVETPDQSELKKHSTFLESTERSRVTIASDSKANADDATWLYKVDESTIKDIYGNDGTENSPYTISTAEQLLSFAYEVKAGKDFEDQYVKLDANIVLQPDVSSAATVDWIGVGDDSHAFNGHFVGGVRLISRLKDKPFFAKLGPKAHVGQLILENVIGINGNGGFASVNEGVICACKVDGDVTSDASEPVGSFVGTNNGVVFGCYHTGDLTATSASAVGGLVGSNEGTGVIVASCNYGKITGKNDVTPYGVLGQNNASYPNVVYGCFYDTTQASNVSAVAPNGASSPEFSSEGKTTAEMMKSSFVNCLNGIINAWSDNYKEILTDLGYDADHFKSHYYEAQPAGYPYVY